MGVDLFSQFNIGRLELRNRFVRSATWDGTADVAGEVTEKSVAIYRKLAAGEIGLIVTGYAFVSLQGQATFGQYGIYSDELIPGLKRLTEVVHQKGGKIAVQIVHAGISAVPGISSAPAVSVLPHIEREHHEMTGEEIEQIIDDFAAAARRAVEAGFDAVQLHGAHGYLMSQFLSPSKNLRRDKWGGSLENRARFNFEVIRRIRKEVGRDYPLLIKFGIRDESDSGLKLEEGIQVASWMVREGVDAIEVSAGVATARSAIPILRPEEPERAVFRERASALKKKVDAPVALVGGIRSLSLGEDIVSSGDADLISMCRPFIREPDILVKWKNKSSVRSTCVSCNQCMRLIREQGVFACGRQINIEKEGSGA